MAVGAPVVDVGVADASELKVIVVNGAPVVAATVDSVTVNPFGV